MIRLILIIAILAVVIIVAVRLQGNAYKRFMENSAEVTGRIEKKETRFDNTKNKRHEHYLLYSYVVDGKEYRGEERVEYDDMWQEARERMPLRVYYSKSNPAQSYPAALIDRRLTIAQKLE